MVHKSRLLAVVRRCLFLKCTWVMVFLAGAVTAGVAQGQADSPPSFSVSVVRQVGVEIPPLFVRQVADGEEVFEPVAIGTGRRSGPREVALQRNNKLFTGDFDEDGEPRMEPFLDLDDVDDGDRLLVLFLNDFRENYRTLILQDHEEIHPAGSVRIVNATRSTAMFSFGDERIVLAPEKDRVVKPDFTDGLRFPAQVFIKRDDGSFNDTSRQMLRLPNNRSRMMMLLTLVQSSREVEGQTGEEVAYETTLVPGTIRLFDTVSTPFTGAAASVAPDPDRSNFEARSRSAARRCFFQLVELGKALNGSGRVTVEPVEGGPGGEGQVLTERGDELELPEPGNVELEVQANGRSLGRIEAGAQYERVLLTVMPGFENSSAQVAAFETSMQSHPRGALRVFNLTPFSLACGFGGQMRYVSPMRDVVFRSEAGPADAGESWKVAIRTPGGWKVIQETPSKERSSNEREALFVHKETGGDEFVITRKLL